MYEKLIKDIIDMAKECGLSTFNEAILNYEMHALQLLPFSAQEEIQDMLNKIQEDVSLVNLTLVQAEDYFWTTKGGD